MLGDHAPQAILAKQYHRLLQAGDRLCGAVVDTAGNTHDFTDHQRIATHQSGQLATRGGLAFERTQQLRQHGRQPRQAAHVETRAEQLQSFEQRRARRGGLACAGCR